MRQSPIEVDIELAQRFGWFDKPPNLQPENSNDTFSRIFAPVLACESISLKICVGLDEGQRNGEVV